MKSLHSTVLLKLNASLTNRTILEMVNDSILIQLCQSLLKDNASKDDKDTYNGIVAHFQ